MSESTHQAHYEVRDSLLDALRKDLLGPVGGVDEVLTDDAPITMYPVGVLFPAHARTGPTTLPGPARPSRVSWSPSGTGSMQYHSAPARTSRKEPAIWVSRCRTSGCRRPSA